MNVPRRQPAVRTGTMTQSATPPQSVDSEPIQQGKNTLLGALRDAQFKQTEKQFQSQVIRYAELMGWRVWHDRATNAPRACPKCHAPIRLPRNDPGFPDLVLTRRPRVVWVELKGQRTPVTVAQRDWLMELRASGQEAYLFRPSDWQEIEQVLGRFDRPVEDR